MGPSQETLALHCASWLVCIQDGVSLSPGKLSALQDLCKTCFGDLGLVLPGEWLPPMGGMDVHSPAPRPALLPGLTPSLPLPLPLSPLMTNPGLTGAARFLVSNYPLLGPKCLDF